MLHLHRGERADVLAGALGELLAGGVEDPFQPEIVSVPSRGVERWLTQQLSLVLGARAGGYDGVCANVQFLGPGRLVAEAVGAVTGMETREDPWRAGRSVWPLLELLESSSGSVGVSAPAPSQGRSRQYAAARHAAELFDKYALFRPEMVLDWAAGGETDGAGSALAEDVRWQPRLWRELRALLALPSPAERLAPACAQLRIDASAVELPERISLFGLTRIPPAQLRVLAALAEHRDVHLWLLHPCAPLWEALAASGALGVVRRGADRTAGLVKHRLLSSLGRDVRELQLTLGSLTDTPVVDAHHPLPVPPPEQQETVLHRLQRSIRADALTPEKDRPLIASGDRSIQVHACHGRTRQVDVVRDVILGLLASDPTLEPRDIIVMCPDIETFAPLISATFGVGADPGAPGEEEPLAGSPAALLRVRLADRSLRQTNPMMSAAATLLDLVDGRLTASEVLDFAAQAPVRRRFGFDDDELARLTEWVAEAQIRWGLDAAHRAPFKLDAFPQNTWEAGLDRLLLGVAMADGPAGGDASANPSGTGWLGLALPLDDVDSSDIELVGRLAELVERLRAAVDSLAGPQSLGGWVGALGSALESLTLTSAAELWQAAQLRSELASLVEAAGERVDRVTLTLADLRVLLADRLRGRPTRANFRTGSLTMCTLVPMRSVPHRVVCLLGLDDGAFPRQSSVDGDDILLRDPITGERDARSEDRQLLLDAILSAGEHLVLTYSGADERTNASRPPAVPVGELLDALDAGFRTAGGMPVRRQLLTRHPLQPFDPANFTAAQLGVAGAFSFDPSALAGARAMSAPRHPPAPFLVAPLPAAPETDLELDALRQFFEHPVRGFLRSRLGVTLPRADEEASDSLSIELDALSRWQIGQRMLDSRLSGLDQAACRQAEWRRGALPPGRLGVRVLDDVAAQVEQIVVEVAALRERDPRTLDLSIEVSPGRRLTGTVGGIYGSTLVSTSFSKMNHKRRFRGWLTLLLLAAARPQEQFDSVGVGRRSQTAAGPVEALEAQTWLADLVTLYDLGMQEPLPIASEASFEYAQARHRGAETSEALKLAIGAWEDQRSWGGEQKDPEHTQVYGLLSPFTVLIGPDVRPPAARDRAELWLDETTRFGVLSRRWWDPMLEGEQRARG